jgi:hypothetical protein
MTQSTWQQQATGNIFWKTAEGIVHREDGPAIEAENGSKYWFFNGKQHRVDGPATIHADGSEYWIINNISVKKEDIPLCNGDEDNLLVLKLKYGF